MKPPERALSAAVSGAQGCREDCAAERALFSSHLLRRPGRPEPRRVERKAAARTAAARSRLPRSRQPCRALTSLRDTEALPAPARDARFEYPMADRARSGFPPPSHPISEYHAGLTPLVSPAILKTPSQTFLGEATAPLLRCRRFSVNAGKHALQEMVANAPRSAWSLPRLPAWPHDRRAHGDDGQRGSRPSSSLWGIDCAMPAPS